MHKSFLAASAATLAASLALSACSGLPKVLGNDQGGMIDWAFTNEQEVFEAATRHCAQYKKAPRITSIQKRAGGSVLFDCV
jgi:hypothetical protein